MRAGVKASVPKTLITILCGYRGHKNVFVNDFMHSVFKHKTSFILCRFLTGWNVLMRFQLIFTGNMVCHVFVLNIN